MTNKEEQRKKRIAASQNAGGAMFNLMNDKGSSNPIAKTFSDSTKEAQDYKPKSSDFSSPKNTKTKSKKQTNSKHNKEAKKQEPNKTSNKANKSQLTKLKKSATRLFHGKKPTKPVKYGNIRVKQHVVDDLHSLQEITNYRSRSDLLDQMITLTKKLVLTSPKLKKEYKNNIKHYETIRSVK